MNNYNTSSCIIEFDPENPYELNVCINSKCTSCLDKDMKVLENYIFTNLRAQKSDKYRVIDLLNQMSASQKLKTTQQMMQMFQKTDFTKYDLTINTQENVLTLETVPKFTSSQTTSTFLKKNKSSYHYLQQKYGNEEVEKSKNNLAQSPEDKIQKPNQEKDDAQAQNSFERIKKEFEEKTEQLKREKEIITQQLEKLTLMKQKKQELMQLQQLQQQQKQELEQLNELQQQEEISQKNSNEKQEKLANDDLTNSQQKLQQEQEPSQQQENTQHENPSPQQIQQQEQEQQEKDQEEELYWKQQQQFMSIQSQNLPNYYNPNQYVGQNEEDFDMRQLEEMMLMEALRQSELGLTLEIDNFNFEFFDQEKEEELINLILNPYYKNEKELQPNNNQSESGKNSEEKDYEDQEDEEEEENDEKLHNCDDSLEKHESLSVSATKEDQQHDHEESNVGSHFCIEKSKKKSPHSASFDSSNTNSSNINSEISEKKQKNQNNLENNSNHKEEEQQKRKDLIDRMVQEIMKTPEEGILRIKFTDQSYAQDIATALRNIDFYGQKLEVKIV